MAMEKSTQKSKRTYLNDIQPNLAGEYTYVGPHYLYADKEKSYTRAKIECSTLVASCILAFILPGLVTAGGMGNCAYVILPYMAEAIALFVTLWAAVKMLVNGNKLRGYIYEATLPRIPVGSVFVAVFAAAGTACIVVYIILNGIGGSVGEIILLFAAKALSIISALLLRRKIKGMVWEKDRP